MSNLASLYYWQHLWMVRLQFPLWILSEIHKLSFLKNQSDFRQSDNQLKFIANDSQKRDQSCILRYQQSVGQGLAVQTWKIGNIWAFLKLLETYLNNRKQGVLFNSETSVCGFIKSGVPQGTILWPLFSRIYKWHCFRYSILYKTVCRWHNALRLLLMTLNQLDVFLTAT